MPTITGQRVCFGHQTIEVFFDPVSQSGIQHSQAHPSANNRRKAHPKSCANAAHDSFQAIDLIIKYAFSIMGATDSIFGSVFMPASVSCRGGAAESAFRRLHHVFLQLPPVKS